MTKAIHSATAILLVWAGAAGAVGLDRSNQDIGALFEPGGFAELSFGMVMPSLGGTEYPIGPITPPTYDNVGNDFTALTLSFKTDVTENVSLALIVDQPYGVDVAYDGNPASTRLGGTAAFLESRALTAIGRYRFNENFSAHAGVRYQTLSADVTLSGVAYAGLNGYNVALTGGSGTGWLAGVAYERPAIALRVALTYHSASDIEFDAVETLNGNPIGAGTTTVTAPEAWNLDFQTGIAENTLLFGSIRRAMYSDTLLTPDTFGALTGGASITDIEDGNAYTLGIGRRFSDQFSGSISVGYEPEGSDDLVSPLSPTNGNMSLGIGGQYTMDNVVLSGGIRYTWLGDARPETGTPDVPHGDFTGNSALAVGFSIGYRF